MDLQHTSFTEAASSLKSSFFTADERRRGTLLCFAVFLAAEIKNVGSDVHVLQQQLSTPISRALQATNYSTLAGVELQQI